MTRSGAPLRATGRIATRLPPPPPTIAPATSWVPSSRSPARTAATPDDRAARTRRGQRAVPCPTDEGGRRSACRSGRLRTGTCPSCSRRSRSRVRRASRKRLRPSRARRAGRRAYRVRSQARAPANARSPLPAVANEYATLRPSGASTQLASVVRPSRHIAFGSMTMRSRPFRTATMTGWCNEPSLRVNARTPPPRCGRSSCGAVIEDPRHERPHGCALRNLFAEDALGKGRLLRHPAPRLRRVQPLERVVRVRYAIPEIRVDGCRPRRHRIRADRERQRGNECTCELQQHRWLSRRDGVGRRSCRRTGLGLAAPKYSVQRTCSRADGAQRRAKQRYMPDTVTPNERAEPAPVAAGGPRPRSGRRAARARRRRESAPHVSGRDAVALRGSRRRAGDRGGADRRRCTRVDPRRAGKNARSTVPSRGRFAAACRGRRAARSLCDCRSVVPAPPSTPSTAATSTRSRACSTPSRASCASASPGLEVYRKRARPDYFRDPKLFWYVANKSDTTVERMAPNVVAVVQTMLERGVEIEH